MSIDFSKIEVLGMNDLVTITTNKTQSGVSGYATIRIREGVDEEGISLDVFSDGRVKVAGNGYVCLPKNVWTRENLNSTLRAMQYFEMIEKLKGESNENV